MSQKEIVRCAAQRADQCGQKLWIYEPVVATEASQGSGSHAKCIGQVFKGPTTFKCEDVDVA